MSVAQLLPGVALASSAELFCDIPETYQFLFEPYPYKIAWSGRDAAKSWSFARALITLAYTRKLRILCTREVQVSIKDSVHKLLSDQIKLMDLASFFEITQTEIRCWVTGSEFIFAGLKITSQNQTSIKSKEKVNVCWVEEGQAVSKDSWEMLIPTIFRVPGAEIWCSWNPVNTDDDTYVRFVPRCETCQRTFDHEQLAYEHKQKLPEHVVQLPPKNAAVRKTSFRDNPCPTEQMEEERRSLKARDPEGYAHVYEGECVRIGDLVIFRGRYVIESFTAPTVVDRWFNGIDFGYAVPGSPAAALKSYITKEKEWPNPFGANDPLKRPLMLPSGEHLWVYAEAFAHGVENDDLHALLGPNGIDAGSWPVKGDSSRPETISHLRAARPEIGRAGFNVSAAEKWPGSLDDGIYHLKQFVLIHVHPRCKNFQVECRNYKWKSDPKTKEPLPIIVDAWNHGWSALRYSLDGYIQRRGAAGVWAKLGQGAK